MGSVVTDTPAPIGGMASDWTRPFLNNRRATNYQRVCTNQAVSTLMEYTCRVLRLHSLESEGSQAVDATHDTLPQVIKVTALYYKKHIYTIYIIIQQLIYNK